MATSGVKRSAISISDSDVVGRVAPEAKKAKIDVVLPLAPEAETHETGAAAEEAEGESTPVPEPAAKTEAITVMGEKGEEPLAQTSGAFNESPYTYLGSDDEHVLRCMCVPALFSYVYGADKGDTYTGKHSTSTRPSPLHASLSDRMILQILAPCISPTNSFTLSYPPTTTPSFG